MTKNNIPWEEDSIKVNDADGNLAFEVIDLIKPEKLVPTYVKGAEYWLSLGWDYLSRYH